MTQSNLIFTENHEIPEGYKKTELGIIPNDWQLECIGNIVNITTGNKNTQDRIPEGKYPFFVRSQKIERINSFSFDGEGVLTAGDGVGTGKVYHYINGKFDFHQRVYLMHSFNQKVHGYYFYIYFSNNFYDRIMSMTAKSSVDSVRRDMISNMKIVLPPLREQKKIATALFDTDVLISELEKLIEKKQAIKTATMQQLLTGKTRLLEFALREDGTPKTYKESELGQIPEDWNSDPIGNILFLSNKRINPSFNMEGDYCLELEHLSQGGGRILGNTFTTRNSSIKSIFEPNDILFGKLRAYLRKYWFADMQGVCSTEIWVLKANKEKTDPKFGFYVVQMEEFIKAASEAYGTHMPRSDWRVVQNYLVAVPPINEQKSISTILSQMDADIEQNIYRVEKLKKMKQGMMQELLTGKTRLV